MDKKEFKSLKPVHPTELIVDEIKARGWSYDDVAKQLGMSIDMLTEMIEHKTAIGGLTARDLEKVFGIKASFWLKLQNDYDKDLSLIEHDGLDEYIEKGWLSHMFLSDYRYDEKSVKKAIKWAIDNPNWHKYPDKKPKHKGRYLIIAQEDKDIYIADFIPNNNVWFGIVLDPIAWMELPKFNG